MRRPGDELLMTRTGAAVPSRSSALAALRERVEAPMVVYASEPAQARVAGQVLENLELDLRHNCRASTRLVAEGLRQALAQVTAASQAAGKDLRGLLEDVTSPTVYMTLEDVLGRVQNIRAQLA